MLTKESWFHIYILLGNNYTSTDKTICHKKHNHVHIPTQPRSEKPRPILNKRKQQVIKKKMKGRQKLNNEPPSY